MQWMLPIEIAPLTPPMGYGDKLLLVGSCFAEHIGRALSDLKLDVLQNPNGILFNPASICRSLSDALESRTLTEADLFCRDGVWHHWQYHGRLSATDPAAVLGGLSAARERANQRLCCADWLVLTLGSAFAYRLTRLAVTSGAAGGHVAGDIVANCHRAPSDWFERELLSVDHMAESFGDCLTLIRSRNPSLQVLLTVSPVRHQQDGAVGNNRSKARLIELAHRLTASFTGVHYFPAYELVIDVLRDYRFFEADLVHPSALATEFVLEQFVAKCIRPGDHGLIKELKRLVDARRHRPHHPGAASHRQFLQAQLARTKRLARQYPTLDFSEELRHFASDG